jgi:hypothetical protein
MTRNAAAMPCSILIGALLLCSVALWPDSGTAGDAGEAGAPVDSAAVDSTGGRPVAAGDEAARKRRTPAPAAARPFAVGEKLTFSVRYEFVKAGEATIAVEDIVDHEGRRAYRFATVARSTMPFSLVFEVEDRVESLLDVEKLHSLRYEKNIREGHYEKHEVVVFDQDRHVAIYPGGKEVPLEPDALDVLSSLFYVRLMDLEVGKSVFIDNHADGKNYSLEIKVLREETIEVPAGEFDCYVAEPILKAAGIFQHEGRLTVWIAKEHDNIPVKMESRIIIGAIKALLIRMENVGG